MERELVNWNLQVRTIAPSPLNTAFENWQELASESCGVMGSRLKSSSSVNHLNLDVS